MKNTEYYECLPDALSTDQLESEFIDLLRVDHSRHAAKIADALFELSERQWHTYELLSTPLRKRVTSTMLDIWDDGKADLAETLLCVTSRLGLGDMLAHLRSKTLSSFTPEVRRIIEEAFQEFGDSVDDPYSGLKQ